MIENSFSEDLEVIKQITRLQGMSKPELHATWDKFFDHPPEILSNQHMIAKLAYRIQELAYGDLDSETEKKIADCAKESMKGCVKNKKSKKFSPMIGTKIMKEYHDKMHEVLVVNNGFAYNGEVFKSLSAIATKITGTKWNGLKFFNLKG